MLRLSVNAIASIQDDEGKEFHGRIHLRFLELGFTWSSAEIEPVFISYHRVFEYRISNCGHDDLPLACLVIRYNAWPWYDVSKPYLTEIHLNFVDSEPALVAVVRVLQEFVDVEGLYPDGTSCYPSVAAYSSQHSCTTKMVRTQVTFLQFVNDMLLAGVGDFLQIFKSDKTNISWELLVKRQVFKGQHIHGLRMRGSDMITFGGKQVTLLRLFTYDSINIRSIYSLKAPDWVLDCVWLEDERAALLTANNALVLCKLPSLSQPVIEAVHHCHERCILYSGTILGDSWNDLVVLAGTVFSTIVIWKNSEGNHTKDIIHRLEGHKGVIFSIAYCEKTQRLSSTSDDRSVRVWDVRFEEPCNWKSCAITLKFTLYGHSARVWRSSLLECGKIVSVGEDSRVCLWSSDGTLETQFSGHQEGEVWSLDVNEKLQLIATGGSDCGISLWPLKKARSPHDLKSSDEHLKPKCVGLSAQGRPFMVSWTGDVFLYHSSWKLHLREPELKSYCLHAVTPDRQLIAFGSITGRIIICRLLSNAIVKIIEMNVCDGRIFSLIWTSRSSIVICESDGHFSLWKLSIDALTLTKEADFILPPSKERWVTSCSTDGNYVVCGDRCGSLCLYVNDGQTKNSIHVAKKIHGHNGVTDVKYLNGKFVSTGRDGRCREFLVVRNQLVMVRCYKLKLDWAAAVFDSDILGRVLFCFHDMNFVIWNIKDRREIVRIDCGGGHRSWDCIISSEQKEIFMTFIKGKSVRYCRIPLSDILCRTLLPGNHPKSINSAEFVSRPGEAAGGSKLILLGGEDTTLRLVSVEKDDQTELHVLQSHLSSVRAVACHRSVFDNTLYIASGGGRGQVVFWKAYLPEERTVGEDAVPDIIELNSYSVISQLETGVSSDAAEMRIMDLQVYQTSGSLVMLAACCSDGILRIFSFSVETNDILEVQAIDCQNCLLKVRVCTSENPFLIATTTRGSLFIYSIETSGLLKNDDTVQRIMASDNGLNSCDYNEVNEGLIVACAGDDAVLNILLFCRNSPDSRLNMTGKWEHNATHTCQISGLKLVDNLMFTVALDQILAIFSWTISGEQIRAQIINRVDLCIPDIHGLLVWPHFEEESFNILVYGLGTQLLTCSMKSN